MRPTTLLLGGAITILAATLPARGQTATWQTIPMALSARDMTPSGCVVVGLHAGGGYYWSWSGGLVDIGGLGAVAVSDDGSVILGNIDDPDTGADVAAIWTEADGWQSLGGLGSSCGSISSGWELSGDGTVATGLGWNNCSGQGFQWTATDGMSPLELLANGNNRSSVVSADGSVFAGFAQGTSNRTPARWLADGTGETLDPAADVVGETLGISDSGDVLLGRWNGSAFTWTEANGETLLGSLVPGRNGNAVDIDDAGTIVGYDSTMFPVQAWIRPAETEIITDLRGYLQGLGAAIPGDVLLLSSAAISADGRVIIGAGTSGPWIARITPECAADFDGSGDVGFSDLTQLLGVWGPCPGCPEDLNVDCVVGFADLTALLAAWGPC